MTPRPEHTENPTGLQGLFLTFFDLFSRHRSRGPPGSRFPFRTPFRKNPSVPLLSGEFGERARGVRLYLRETLALVNVG